MKAGQKKGIVSDKKQKMWQVMRGLNTFTIDDIARLTGYDMTTVISYVSRLFRAGYLRVEGKERVAGKRPRRTFRLIKNTGVFAPYEAKAIYDPNLKKVVLDVD